MKIGIIGDYHLGLKQDSESQHNVALDCSRWIIDTFRENGVSCVIFTGDLFHHREEINNSTLNVANRIIESFATEFEEIHIVTGNHDCFYRDDSRINSLVPFNGKFNRVFIYDKNPCVTRIGECDFGFYPWGSDIKTSDFQKARIAVGHFELMGFKMNGSKICEAKTTFEDASKLADLVLTGHFHSKQTKGNVVYVGTPYQMDWSDYGEEKGIHILDTKTLKMKFIQNLISPIHVVIDGDFLEEKIRNNIVRVKSAEDITPKQKEALSLSHSWSVDLKKKEELRVAEIQSERTLDNFQLLEEYVEGLNIDVPEIANIVKQRVKDFRNFKK